jgi:hypothetical protein
MAETKYGKYIITEMKKKLKFLPTTGEPPPTDERSIFLWLDDEVLKGAFYMECVWFWKTESHPPGAASEHSHKWDEILGFFGTNPEDPYDLGGEVELWLGDEKHVMTKSFLVFIPGGLKHRAVYIARVDRPIFHIATGPSTEYSRDSVK